MSASDLKCFNGSFGSSTSGSVACKVLGCEQIAVSGGILANGGIVMGDGDNIALGSTTGTKIGTNAAQKLGFYNQAPEVQPTTAIAEGPIVAGAGAAVLEDTTFNGYTIGQIVAALQRLGLLA
jgi:hypothetical protein